MYPQLEILEDVRDMASLMERADLAISAGGTTVLELAVVGVPTIAFSSAPDQVPGLLYMQREGMCRYAGQAADEGFMDRMFYHFDELLTDDRLRLRLHTEARRHLDGNGAARIAGALIRAGGGA